MNLLFLSNKEWGKKTFEYFKKNTSHKCIFAKNKTEFNVLIKKNNYDFIFVLHWSDIIKKSVVSKMRVIGFHASKLPRFSGGSPIQNQIIRGINKTYLTCYLMNEKLDDGPIITQYKLDLSGKLSDILNRCHLISIKMINKIINLKSFNNLKKNNPVKSYKRLTYYDNNIEIYKGLRKIYDLIRMVDSKEYKKSYLKTKNNLKITFSNAKINKNTIYCDAIIKLKK